MNSEKDLRQLRDSTLPLSVTGALWLAGAMLIPGWARADAGQELSTIVVTATRYPQSSEELPVSIDRLDAADISQGQRQVNLSESLDAVTGVSVQNRQNYAQDLQISVRGFGARSQFGVRGVRLYSDGIPGTMPDGQGQFSQFDLGSAKDIEVLRGPFSALYGNSSGGVISIFTRDGRPGFGLTGTVDVGSLGTERYALLADGASGAVNYVLDASHFQTDGFRVHSAAQRNLVNGKIRLELDETSRLTFVANAVTMPANQDPLGLTAQQLASDRTQAGTNAVAYNSRKSLNQEQLGAIYEKDLGGSDTLQAMVYAGHRGTVQYQAIPRSTEMSPTNPGGVIDLNRYFTGTDVHLTDRRELLGGPIQWTAGVSFDNLQEHRKGFTNFIGGELGVEGSLRRFESNRVYDVDEYLQAQWDPVPRWRAIAGVRNSVVEVADHNLLPGAASPDSGVRYSAVNPVAGVVFRASSFLRLYGSYGRGFETPTLNDLAYRSTDGSIPGLNLGLKAARSDNYELGVKAGGERLRTDLAGFYVHTQNELAVQSNAAGKSVYENIGPTQRRGAEASLQADLGAGFSSRLGYTYLNAVTLESYASCAGAPCKHVIVRDGSHLPAVPEDQLYAALSWGYVPLGFKATVEVVSRARIFADDRNLAAADGYTIANMRLGLEQQTVGWRLSEYVRVDNLANHPYVGSVIVNENNQRFFEPEPGRTFDLIFSISRRD